MAAVLSVHTAKPVVEGATIKFTRTELDFLRVALRTTYKADQDVYPFSGVEHKLYAAIDSAYKGNGS